MGTWPKGGRRLRRRGHDRFAEVSGVVPVLECVPTRSGIAPVLGCVPTRCSGREAGGRTARDDTECDESKRERKSGGNSADSITEGTLEPNLWQRDNWLDLQRVRKLCEAAAAVEKWEGDLVRLQKDFDVEVKDDMRAAIFLEM